MAGSKPTIADRIRKEGRNLGEANLRLRPKAELKLLRAQLEENERLVAVYGKDDQLGYSATPLDDFRALNTCRRSTELGMSCTYYAVPAEIIPQPSDQKK